MRAARYYGKEDIRVEEIEEPEPKPGQLKVKPAFVGICGTDLHEYLGGPNFCPTTAHPITHESNPVVMGHEFSGTVTALGSSSSSYKIGDRITVHPSLYDYTCGACTSNLPNVCYNGGFIGLSGGGGGLSDYLTIPEDHAHILPSSVSLEIGALVEPLAVAWHALSISPLTPSSNILILGGGPIGIAIILCLRAQGCGTIVVSELSAARSKFARNFGADHVLDPSKEGDYVGRAKELCGGEGPDIVFDCAGVASALEAACKCLKVRGTVVNVAIWEKPIMFQPNELVWKEGRYVTTLGSIGQDFRDVIQAIATGRMKPGDMVTKKIALEDVVEGGFKTLVMDKDNQVKVMVDLSMASGGSVVEKKSVL